MDQDVVDREHHEGEAKNSEYIIQNKQKFNLPLDLVDLDNNQVGVDQT
jgi:hypothetical protein